MGIQGDVIVWKNQEHVKYLRSWGLHWHLTIQLTIWNGWRYTTHRGWGWSWTGYRIHHIILRPHVKPTKIATFHEVSAVSGVVPQRSPNHPTQKDQCHVLKPMRSWGSPIPRNPHCCSPVVPKDTSLTLGYQPAKHCFEPLNKNSWTTDDNAECFTSFFFSGKW